LNYATAIGAGATVHASDLIVLGRNTGQDAVWIWGETLLLGELTLNDFADGGGTTPVCYGGFNNNVIARCSSSIRYKENVENYTRGLDLITKLRPVSYDWKSTGKRDVGFIAEEVNEIEPLLNIFEQNGQIEGVKYAHITTALVNAVKEQQAQIKQQQAQIDALKALVCVANPGAAACQPDRK
jgi:hypothetical protein